MSNSLLLDITTRGFVKSQVCIRIRSWRCDCLFTWFCFQPAYWKAAVTPLLTHWRYCSLTLSQLTARPGNKTREQDIGTSANRPYINNHGDVMRWERIYIYIYIQAPENGCSDKTMHTKTGIKLSHLLTPSEQHFLKTQHGLFFGKCVVCL